MSISFLCPLALSACESTTSCYSNQAKCPEWTKADINDLSPSEEMEWGLQWEIILPARPHAAPTSTASGIVAIQRSTAAQKLDRYENHWKIHFITSVAISDYFHWDATLALFIFLGRIRFCCVIVKLKMFYELFGIKLLLNIYITLHNFTLVTLVSQAETKDQQWHYFIMKSVPFTQGIQLWSILCSRLTWRVTVYFKIPYVSAIIF